MCHLVVDSSSDVQTMAYTMLREAAAKRTEHIVVEAAVDTETEFKAELPLELVELLQRSLQQVDDTTAAQNILGSLLSWSLAFDLFEDAVSLSFLFPSKDKQYIDMKTPVTKSQIRVYGTSPKA